ASDDGLPAGGGLTVAWSMVQGPAAVTFGDSASASTTATLPSPGVYVLRLSASDSLLTSTDETTVVVGSPGQAPDLTVMQVDTSALVVDPQTLAVSGVVAARTKNIGTGPAVGPFTTLFFEDKDGDGAFGPGDTVLGQVDEIGVDAGAFVTVTAAVSGGVT